MNESDDNADYVNTYARSNVSFCTCHFSLLVLSVLVYKVFMISEPESSCHVVLMFWPCSCVWQKNQIIMMTTTRWW